MDTNVFLSAQQQSDTKRNLDKLEEDEAFTRSIEELQRRADQYQAKQIEQFNRRI